ncbi:LPS translocon maturation chaperone LptM [Rhodoferax sp.]|uniref:LPS translocon maturation chaperone LptM n=1 Tax=Rhodoferax sp. TaxID=50421 RepID=UPI00284B6C52|nr:lipoprotein [Rhodoferax sp.]MDR3370029.1 lipoprotein [Rhodoferax sp.]
MLFKQILVRALALVSMTIAAVILAACGQTGDLYMPKPPAGTRQATLPETLIPGAFKKSAPATGTQAASPDQPASAPIQ